MIDLRVKLSLKSFGEVIAAFLVIIASIIGAVWTLFNAPIGISITVIVLGIIGLLTYHQYKERADLKKRIEEVKNGIFYLGNKIAAMVENINIPLNEIDTHY